MSYFGVNAIALVGQRRCHVSRTLNHDTTIIQTRPPGSIHIVPPNITLSPPTTATIGRLTPTC